MTKKHFLNEILSPKLLFIAWGFILVVCVFIGFSIRGKCATSPDYSLPLPIGIPKKLYDETGLTTTIVNQAIDRYLTILSTQYSFDGSDNYTVFVSGRDDKDLIIIVTYGLVCGHLPENDPNFSQDWQNLYYNNTSQHYVQFQYDGDTGTLSNGEFYGGWVSTWSFNRANLNYGIGWVLASVNEISDYWTFQGEEPSVTGHATPPDLTGDNIDTDKPDIDDYLPTLPNMPTIDNSSLEKIAESIFNILQWGFNAIKGTLQGLFEYLGDLLSYSFQKVIDNIKNAIQNLYDNFVSLFEPLLNGIASLLNSISQKLDYISQPFDSEALQEAFENTAISDDIDSISQLNEQAFGTWSTTEEPNQFKIALHTEQIPLADNVNFTTTTQYIDLGVINGAKPYIRGVMWCLLTFSLLYTIIDSIPNYIGGNDE